MTKLDTRTYEDFVLPSVLVSRLDVSRMVSEVERIDSDMSAASIRHKSGSATNTEGVISDQLMDFLDQNKLTLDDSHVRHELIKQLRVLKDKVPVIHMTFAVDADRESLQKLTQWAREFIHPHAIIAVGLQPALVAGVYVRTPNHVHDFSLRGMLNGKHEALVKELGVLRGSK